MKKERRSLIISILVLFLFVNVGEACRFWVAVSPNVKEGTTINQLIEEPNSLKFLGKEHEDGWSVGYYKDGRNEIHRGSDPSDLDSEYNLAVKEVAQKQAQIVFAHLRQASSGCVDGVPNPHPFKIIKNDKVWLFGHNGGMKKSILIDLIGDEYMDKHPPQVCTYDAPKSWIDSELYFIYLLKNIEENGWDVEQGLLSGLRTLYTKIGEGSRYLNFFLTDGDNVWAFRRGTSLFYQYDPKSRLSYASSGMVEET